MNNEPIIVERQFNSPSSRMWNALTDKNEMKSWYLDLQEFRPEEGFKFSFTDGPSPEKQFVHLCEVTEVIPGKKLSYSWVYEGYSGYSVVTFELFEQGDKTLLKLTHDGVGTFPADNEDFARNNFVEGWNEIINQSLNNYLEKNN